MNQRATNKNDSLFSLGKRSNICKLYEITFFAKNMIKNSGKKINKSLSSKYSEKLLDHAIQPATGRYKISSQKEQFKIQQKQFIFKI